MSDEAPNDQTRTRHDKTDHPAPQLPREVGHQTRPAARVTAVRTESVQFEGPLPPPDLLKAFQDAGIKDAPERFMRMVESQHNHRLGMETFVTRWDARLALIGQFCTTLIVLAFLTASVLIIIVNHASPPSVVGGSILGGLDLVGLAALLITRERAGGRSEG